MTKDQIALVPAALRVRSHFSDPAGPASPAALVARAVDAGFPALALTETGTLISLDEFLDSAGAAGLTAHAGAEVLVRLRRGSAPHPLLLLCESEEGYRNLSRLLSLDDPGPEDLFGLRSGLVALTGFPGSEAAAAIGKGLLSAASRSLVALSDLYSPGHAFLAVETPKAGSSQDPALLLASVAARCGLDPVATGGFDLARPGDETAGRLLSRLRGNAVEGAARSPFEARWCAISAEAYRGLPVRALDNALALAARLWRPDRRPAPVEAAFGESRPGLGGRLLARLEDELESLCARVGDESAAPHRRRFAAERAVIGETDAELLAAIVAALPDDSPGLRAVGRAFGSSSLLHHLAGLSPVDPILEGLSFEPSMVGHPEIQIGSSEWDQVARRLLAATGADRLAHPVVVERFTPRGLLAPIARAFGIEGAEISRVASELPAERADLVRLLRERPDLRRVLAALPRAQEVIEVLLALDGAPRQVRTDPRVVLLAPAADEDWAPRMRTGTRAAGMPVAVEITRRAASRLGIAYAMFRRSRHLDALLLPAATGGESEVSWNDRRVWDEICRAETVGVPYLEGRMVQAALRRDHPRSLDALAQLLARTLAGGGESRGDGTEPVFREDAIARIETVSALSGSDARDLLDALASGEAAGLGRARMQFLRGAANHGTALEAAETAFDELSRVAARLRPKGIYLALARQAYLDLVAKRFDPKGYLERELATPGVRRDRRILLAEEAGRFRGRRRVAAKGKAAAGRTGKQRSAKEPVPVARSAAVAKRRSVRGPDQLGLFGTVIDLGTRKKFKESGVPPAGGSASSSGNRARA